MINPHPSHVFLSPAQVDLIWHNGMCAILISVSCTLLYSSSSGRFADHLTVTAHRISNGNTRDELLLTLRVWCSKTLSISSFGLNQNKMTLHLGFHRSCVGPYHHLPAQTRKLGNTRRQYHIKCESLFSFFFHFFNVIMYTRFPSYLYSEKVKSKFLRCLLMFK